MRLLPQAPRSGFVILHLHGELQKMYFRLAVNSPKIADFAKRDAAALFAASKDAMRCGPITT